jgi:hypothetical protein
VSSLQQEFAQIQEKNREYQARRHHNRREVVLHNVNEERLVQILEDLNALTKKKGS